MGWLRDVQVELWVATPELVLAARVVDTLATSRHFVPLRCEGLLDGGGQISQVDGF